MSQIRKILFSLIFLCTSLNLFSYEYQVTACAVFKDEAPYLREWVEFHMAQGVEHFYLYNNLSCDRFGFELEDYIGCGIVEIIPWPYEACDCEGYQEIRCKAYMHCIHRIKNHVRWCAFLDCNEFLFCPNGWPLDLFLRKYKKYGCISVCRQIYGTSHILQAPCGELVKHLLWKCHPKHPCCKPVKAIVQPKYVIDCHCPRQFILKKGHACVNPDKKHSKKDKSHDIFIDKIRINYYVFRDLYFYNSIWNRVHYCCFIREFGCDLDLNLVYDDCILRVCPPCQACINRF